MLRKILYSNDDLAQTAIRLTLAGVLLPHGAQKLLGWFGGYGFAGTMDYFTGTVGLPRLVALAVIVIEFFGPLLLAAGLWVRPAAAAVFGLFTGIIFTAHLQHGFFMNWSGQQAGEGFEYHLLVLGMALALMLSGAGKYAVDNRLREQD